MRAALWAALVVLSTGCQATLAAGVQADRDGSGVVSAGLGLDDEALRELGDPAVELRLDDLRRSGWSVTAPRREDDGLTWVRAAKPFATPEQVALVAAELSSPEGPFRDFRLTRTRSWLKTTLVFTGVIDLTGGLAGLADADLRAKVGDVPLALDPDSLRAGVRVRVEASLPGTRQVWEPAMGERAEVSVRSGTWNLVPLVPVAMAVLLAAAAVVAAVSLRTRR